MEKKLFTNEENISFWKNLILVAIFFTIAPVTIGVSIFSLLSFKAISVGDDTLPGSYLVGPPQSGVRVYAPLPLKVASVSSEIGSSDARAEIVRQYLKYYGSPLFPFADLIVQTADKYKLDYRLITAIAQQESGLCKMIPTGSFNCWGWGITGGNVIGFKSYQDGIEMVSKGIRENYLNQGYFSIPDIMSKYSPYSNGDWSKGVDQAMTDLQ